MTFFAGMGLLLHDWEDLFHKINLQNIFGMYYDGLMDLVASNIAGMSLSLVNVAFGVLVGLLAAVFLFVFWSYKDKLRDAKALLLVVALLSMMPMGAMLVQQKTNLFPKAGAELQVISTEVQTGKNNSVTVYVTLSEPAFAYLGYKDEASGKEKSILAVGKVEMRYGHAFEIKNVNEVARELKVYVNGKETNRMVKLR